MSNIIDSLEKYLIPAEEGLVNTLFTRTYTMYIGTYPNNPASKYKTLSDLKKASTTILFKNKLNALLAASLIYGNKIDRKTNTITLTPYSAKNLLDKKITLYEIKCKRIEFYKYSENHPNDCYTTNGKDIIDYSEIGEYKVSDIFKRIGATIQNKVVYDLGNRKHILDNILSIVRKEVSSNTKVRQGILVYQHNEIMEYDDFVDGEDDHVIIADIEGPYNYDELAEFTNEIDKLIKSINDKLSRETLYKNWKVDQDWDKNEGFITIEKKG